jgi:hypothetical protein
MLKADCLDSDALRRVISGLPEGRARQKYEMLLAEKAAPEEPARYFLAEILSLHRLSLDQCREVHTAKLANPGCRIIQDVWGEPPGGRSS